VSIFDYFRRRARSKTQGEVYRGHYRIPTFERMTPEDACRFQNAIKQQLLDGPGHGAGGQCPIERQLRLLAEGLLVYFEAFIGESREILQKLLVFECLDSFAVDCFHEQTAGEHRIRVSHGYLHCSSIVTAAMVRRTISPEEAKAGAGEYIADEPFEEIVTRALDWFWDPRKKGKGLVTPPDDRFSRDQLEIDAGLMLIQQFFALGHELAHFSAAKGKRLPSLDVLRTELDKEIQSLGLPAPRADTIRVQWLKEVEADVVAGAFIVNAPKLRHVPEPSGIAGYDLIQLVPQWTRALGVETALLIQEMLVFRSKAQRSDSHPPAEIRRRLLRRMVRYDTADADEYLDLVRGFGLVASA